MVRTWEAETGRIKASTRWKPQEHEKLPRSVKSPDEKLTVEINGQQDVTVTNTATSERLYVLDHEKEVLSVSFVALRPDCCNAQPRSPGGAGEESLGEFKMVSPKNRRRPAA